MSSKKQSSTPRKASSGKKSPKDKPSKKKEESKNPKAKSVDDGQLHEPIIQDRIAGMTAGELAIKYNRSRSGITLILEKYAERIQQEREDYLKERQEKINKALDDDVENLTALITKSTDLMLKAVEKLQKQIEGQEIKKGTLVMAIDVAIKAFDKVHSIVLAQQKEASKDG
jgi:molecular chaperone GrpE (heat shock protein)